MIRRARLVARDPQDCQCAIGNQSNIEGTLVLESSGAVLLIGSRTHVGGGTLIDVARRVEIGDDVLIAFDVLVMDHDSHSLDFYKRAGDVVAWMDGRKDWGPVSIETVRIGNKAWIGARAIVLKGVTIGEGAVVGAGSVVTRNVPPWALVAGNPARVVRSLGASAPA